MSSQSNTNTTASSQYVVQDLEERYIRLQVLKNYIDARPQEFGEQWSSQLIHETIRITVKRVLTKEEMEHLRRESYPGYYNPKNFWKP